MLKLTLAALALLMLTACAAISPNTYTDDESMAVSSTFPAVVQHVRRVVVRETGSSAAAYGAVLGGVGGAAAVPASRAAGALLGGGLGGAAGSGAAKVGSVGSLEIIVEVDMGNSGRTLLTVVQGDDVDFTAGERVYLIASHSQSFLTGNKTRWRVVPAV